MYPAKIKQQILDEGRLTKTAIPAMKLITRNGGSTGGEIISTGFLCWFVIFVSSVSGYDILLVCGFTLLWVWGALFLYCVCGCVLRVFM